MQFEDSYPVILTDLLAECRDFYQRWFGFEVVFEAEWFVLLSSGGSRPVSLAFMHPGHPSTPPSPGVFQGDGMFLTFQVADARAEYERLLAGGLQPALMLRDEPWGQCRFGVIDPAGMWLDNRPADRTPARLVGPVPPRQVALRTRPQRSASHLVFARLGRSNLTSFCRPIAIGRLSLPPAPMPWVLTHGT